MIDCTCRITSPTSIASTFGNCWTNAESHAPPAAFSGTRTAPRYDVGMPSSAPGGNSVKKFGRKLSQSTLRRLVIGAVTGVPAMSNVSRSPSFSCSDSAMPSSIEIAASGFASRPQNRPAVSRLVDGIVSAVDRLNSRSARRRARGLSNLVLSSGAPLTATSRPRTIGNSVTSPPVTCASDARTAST